MKGAASNAWRAGVLCLASSALAASYAADTHEEPGDQPLRIIQRREVEFPKKLLNAGISHGEVHLFLDIDADGELADFLIVAFTHHEFANAVTVAVRRWRFERAIVGGRAIASTASLSVQFGVSGVTVIDRITGENRPPATPSHVYRAREISELDRPPDVLAAVAPVNPAAAGEPAITGRAKIDFFIDETGRVRMPVVASADDERLGWAALEAIVLWQFGKPTRAGYPVLARASQVFRFEPGK